MSQLIDRLGMPGRGPLVQRLRLGSGLMLFAYVLFHYFNHMAGHISLAAMEGILAWQRLVWDSLPGTIALYGALIIHVSLGLAKVASIRSWRKPVWEWVQIVLGLAIPWLLLSHIVYTRGAEQVFGFDVDYRDELRLLWPGAALKQSLLLLVVWAHGCIGIHYWLRIRAGYARWFPWLCGLAVAMPSLALTGWITAARRLAHDVPEAGFDTPSVFTGPVLETLRRVEAMAQNGALAVVGLVVAIMVGSWVAMRLRTKVRVTYGDGTVVTASPGMTLLEISRANGIPHMSVCGGRARCSTCRTLIVSGLENLGPVTDAEKKLLAKLNAAPDIRLACQARVLGDIAARPLIQPRSSVIAPRAVDPLGWGVEREVAILFLDIRGFSRISERSLPYDVVFILNSLFGEIGAEIEAARGYIDKFMGDGLMAIFGLASTPQEAARDAIGAALAAEKASRHASRMLTHHLSEPIRIGIGIDLGTVVIGRIGKTSDQTTPSRLTAIGGTVNIAARLESATKELAATIVMSARAFGKAGLADPDSVGTRSTITVHNISQAVDVVAISDPERLAAAFAAAHPAADAARNPAVQGRLPALARALGRDREGRAKKTR